MRAFSVDHGRLVGSRWDANDKCHVLRLHHGIKGYRGKLMTGYWVCTVEVWELIKGQRPCPPWCWPVAAARQAAGL